MNSFLHRALGIDRANLRGAGGRLVGCSQDELTFGRVGQMDH